MIKDFGNNNQFASILNKLYYLASYVNKDKFLRSQIIQVYINKEGEIELVPRVGNHIIVLGDVNDLDEKFEKLMIFYKKALGYAGWNNYKTINLKYNNQIVCVKK